MATHKPSPLRDRLLSNSPDPIRSSILRGSGMGWASPPLGSIAPSSSSIISPLRIAKRETPVIPQGSQVARRSSSSFRHVRNNNLVTNSPFKMQPAAPPTPLRPISVAFPTRRVSGEKRPRPVSMDENSEAENERPFPLKRDRKESKSFQGLLQKEPVTKSPFKQQGRVPESSEVSPSPPLPIPKLSLLTNQTPTIATIVSRLSPAENDHSVLTSGPSPGRSSLVTRRVRGPRLSSGGKKEQNKTVKFHERCDVFEFDCDTSDEGDWEGSDDGERYGGPFQDAEEGDPFFRGDQITDDPPPSELPPRAVPNVSMEDDFYESDALSTTSRSTGTRSILDPDTSITGLVEEMFFSSNAVIGGADSLDFSTPPRFSDIPTDLETEDGMPFERTPHAKLLQAQLQESLQQSQPLLGISARVLPQPPHTPTHQSPRVEETSVPCRFDIASPIRASPHGASAPSPCVPPVLAESTPPSSRPIQQERVGRGSEEVDQVEETGTIVERSPMSPSPIRPLSTPPTRSEGVIPKYKWPRGSQHHSPSVGVDPFESQERSFDEYPKTSNDSMDPNNLSIGHSEVSLSGLDRSDTYHSSDEGPPESVLDQSSFLKEESQKECFDSLATFDTSREAPGDEEVLAGINEDGSRRTSFGPPPRSELSPHVASPPIPITPPLNLSQSSNSSRAVSPRPNIRHRISKEDIRRRLTERRNTLSPSPEPTSKFDFVMEPVEPFPASEMFIPRTEEITSHDNVTPQAEAGAETLGRDKERDRMSIFSALTDVSTETATVECAEKFNIASGLPTPDSLSEKEFGLNASPSLNLNFGSKFSLGGMGLSRSESIARPKVNLDIPARNYETDSGSVRSGASVKVGDVDVNMEMKSALDRLMDDVAGVGGHDEDSMTTEEDSGSFDQPVEVAQPKFQRAATDTELLHMNMNDAPSRTASGNSADSFPPPLPPKDNNIKAREQLILEKRRQARRADQDFVPTRSNAKRLQSQLGLGRPSRRRSMSADDAHELVRRQPLNIGEDMEKLVEEDLLSDSIERELRKLDDNGDGIGKSRYHIREREGTIYASASDDKVSHMPGAGDLETGRAWRTVRRPSDMNEYSQQIKEYRSQANTTKAYGKVFVKVLGLKGVHLPLPQQPSALTCTLNNGIHFVTTPECELGPDCRIDQEFELIEHSKLEFTLTLKIRRDPHIVTQFKSLTPIPVPVPPPPPPVQQSSSRGMRAFFSSSPKKHSKEKTVHSLPTPAPVHRLPENLARYLKPDGTLARAFIQFKDIATRCDTRLFETSYPLIGQRVELGNKFSTLQVGEIVLQIFRLPPLPGVPLDELPQSLEECHRGLRHINWHKVTYFEGVLTQNGGDCNTWRRRLFRVIGANLVAFNDITRKATATIDLKKAIAVQDDQDLRNSLSPLSRSRCYDEDALFGVERSFRLIFPEEQEIIFFADTDEEKLRWLEVFRALVGHIPPHPLWAELLWQRQEEASKRPPKSTGRNSGPAVQDTAGTGYR